MAVRSQNHLAALCQHFPGKLVDYCLMGRYIDTAIFFRAGQAKHVVILVDGSAYGAKAVVTVGQHIGNREFLQSRSPGCLNDSDKCNIVGRQLIEFDLQLVHIAGCIVRLQNSIGDGLFSGLFLGGHAAELALQHAGRVLGIRDDFCSVQQICSAFQ